MVALMAGLIAISIAPAREAAAQPFATLGELRATGALRSNDRIYLTDATGRRVTGSVRELSDTSLLLAKGSDLRRVAGADITKIERRDSIENGLWLGLGAGVGAFAMACKADRDPEHCPYRFHSLGLPTVAVGMTLGALIDRSIRRTFLLAPAQKSVVDVVLRPVLSVDRNAILASFTFRESASYVAVLKR